MLPLLLLPLALVAACDKVPLLAPTGTVITIIPTAKTVSLNSELPITVTVIENGVASGGSGSSGGQRAGAGTPVQNGTLVSFTTTIGRIEPSEARTHNGQVTVKLITGSTSGSPTIVAYSGGASDTNTDIKIGAAAAGAVSVSGTPQTLGASGGSSLITATISDDGGAPIGGVPVTFTTTKGSISPTSATTDSSGSVSATLTTTATADVTATAGAKFAKVTVTVNPAGLATFTASANAAAAGVAVVFTATPTAGVVLTNVHLSFGDGDSKDLGAITSTSPASVPHTYCTPGSYTATATAFDAAGGTSSLNATVLISPLPITLSAPSTVFVGSPATFTANTGVTSAVVSKYVWTFSDGGPQQTTTAPQIQHVFQTRGIHTVRVDAFGLQGCQLGTAPVQFEVQ
jgi:hypothetical protein